MYIVFEWIVGTGKSTQSKMLVELFKTHFPSREVLYVREPGSTWIAEQIRTLAQGTEFQEEMDPICEAYLYAAARAQLLKTKVKPWLDAGGIVVSDRSVISSLAYQGYARDLWIQKVLLINQEATHACLPDIIFYLQANVEHSLKRTFDAAGDKFEKLGKEFFLKVERWYKQIAKLDDFTTSWQEIDASGSPEEVHARIIGKLTALWVM